MMTPAAVKQLKLSPSGVMAYDDCARAYKYKYVDKVALMEKSANLLFGSAVDTVFEQVVRGVVNKSPLPSPSTAFDAAFEEQFSFAGAIKFAKDYTKDDLLAIGRLLVDDFADKFPRFGLTPIVDDKNNPVMQKMLTFEVEEGVLLTGKLDFLAIDKFGRVVVIDFKTARTAATRGFVLVADQLTAYQILVDAHRDEFGIDRVSRVGFIEALKRKVPKASKGTGPYVEEPIYSDRRTDADVELFLDKVRWMADDIRRERFPKKPRLAYNTPCAMCDFADLCQKGDSQSFILPSVFGFSPDGTAPLVVMAPDDETAPAELLEAWF